MSDSETPPRQRKMEPGEHTLIEYRLDELHTMVRDQMREGKEFRFEVRAFMERQKDAESDHRLAIERCSKHGDDIKDLRKSMKSTCRDMPTLWTAITAIATSIAAAIAAIFHRGTP